MGRLHPGMHTALVAMVYEFTIQNSQKFVKVCIKVRTLEAFMHRMNDEKMSCPKSLDLDLMTMSFLEVKGSGLITVGLQLQELRLLDLSTAY